MTNYTAGHLAEQYAAKFLENKGYEILTLNWKTTRCEIDIVSRKDDVIFFVEVKYRQNARHGTGFDYITPAKLKQMAFAAEVWVHIHEWRGEYQLAAIELTADYQVVEFIPELM